MTAKSLRKFQILNLISFTGVLIVNFLANTLPINGKTTSEVSNLFPNLFTPANLTFAIWGLIYLLLLGFIIYQSKGFFKSQHRPTYILNQIGYSFLLSCLANITWIFTWHYLKIKFSLLAMLILLLALITIYQRLKLEEAAYNKAEKYLVRLPFSIYLGWITVATLANLTVLLVQLGWYGSVIPELLWTILMIILAVGAALYVYSQTKDIYYNLVIIWALIGIIIKRMTTSPQILSLIITASLGIIIIIINIIITTRHKSFRG